MVVQLHRVPIRDARRLIGRLSLDKEGFVRTGVDPLLRLGAQRSGAVFRPYRLRRPELTARRAAPREHRGAHPRLLSAGSFAQAVSVAPAKALGHAHIFKTLEF
jgi:hypothetical protein